MERSHAINQEAICRKWQSIVEVLVQFINKTKQLKTHLEREYPKSEEESKEYSQLMNQLLDERQHLLNQFTNLTSLDKGLKKEMLELEEQIKTLMNNHSMKIKQDIKLLQLKKQRGNQYSNPYENLAADGMFLDKKK